MSKSKESFWRKIMKVDWAYTTSLTIPECVAALVSEEGTFGRDPLNLHAYRCVLCGENQLYIVFLGPHFGKARHTEYRMILTQGSGFTRVDLYFLHEMLGFPPFTSVQELDLFLSQKLGAARENP